MDLHEALAREYRIGPIIKTHTPPHGSGNTTLVQTQDKQYVAKFNERQDFLAIYTKAQSYLDQRNIRHNKLVLTRDCQPMTAQGLVLYEYISGESFKILTNVQQDNALRYLALYNQGLQAVPFAEDDLKAINHWDKARSLDFLTQALPTILSQASIPQEFGQGLLLALELLTKHRAAITASRQLIHADPGPDNFVFQGDEVIAIIDFTPEFNHELYSLAQFVYWNHLWHNPQGNSGLIDHCLNIYCPDNTRELFYLLLLRAGLFRLVGPLLDQLLWARFSPEKLEKRFFILRTVMNMLNKQGIGG